jgi:tRNA nucleotidyltransferase/poly(A) polymerase
MIRAIRFKNALRFSIDPATWHAICQECHHVASAVSPERVWQELHKMFEKKVLPSCLRDMAACSLLSTLFPLLQKAPSSIIQERLGMIEHYEGHSLAAALCLLFQGEESLYLSRFADEYRLSRKEKKIIELFAQYGGFHKRVSETELVKLYARPECSDYLAAVATIREDPDRFLKRHQQKHEELRFWIDQVRSKTFLLTGEDLKARGMQPGAEMGKLLEKAFEESVSLRLKDKAQLLKQLKL